MKRLLEPANSIPPRFEQNTSSRKSRRAEVGHIRNTSKNPASYPSYSGARTSEDTGMVPSRACIGRSVLRTQAPFGRSGTLLITPYNFTIHVSDPFRSTWWPNPEYRRHPRALTANGIIQTMAFQRTPKEE